VDLESEPAIKTPDQYTLLGKSVPRLDTPLKVNGSAVYGIDVRVPDMVYAAVEASPVPGGRLVSFDSDTVKDRPGVIAAYRLGEGGIGRRPYNPEDTESRVTGLQSGVAVVADTWYRALTALQLMPKEWDPGEHGEVSDESIIAGALEVLADPDHANLPSCGFGGRCAGRHRRFLQHGDGDLRHSLSGPRVHGAPELHGARHHGPGGRVDRNAEPAGRARGGGGGIGSGPGEVHLHNTFLGSGFGRRLRPDEVRQATAIAAALGRPVKMVWTREENQRQGKLRPYSVYHFAASLDADNKPEAYWNRVVSHSIFNHIFPFFMSNGIDRQAVEGLDRLPYRFANKKLDYAIRDSHFPVQFWRSVGPSQNAFALESFIDELAYAAGADPVEFRLSLMPADSEFRRPLEMAAKEAGWTTDLRSGEGMGVGLAESYGSIVAQIARVTVSRRGQLRVETIDSAIDCGHVIHPRLVEMQVESSIVFGLTAALYGEVHLRNGAVVEDNFDSYFMLRMNEMPEVRTHFALSGGGKWGGVGEPAVPPVAPAVANAIFAATGRRIRRLPVHNHDLTP
jgi:isoquinoline 1-oxidoreductase beta subunit